MRLALAFLGCDDWLKLLLADEFPDEILKGRDPGKAIPPLYGALLKNDKMFIYWRNGHL